MPFLNPTGIERPEARPAVNLALRRAGADRAPGDHVGDVLRGDRVEESKLDRQAQVRHLQQQQAPGGVQPDVHVAGTRPDVGH